MQNDIVVDGLAKSFGTLTAVRDVSFSVYKGEVFGILGPNGAGKTTTLECMEGLQKPSAGQTFVLGIDSQREPHRLKEHIGIQLQASAYFDYLNLREILELFGRFYPRHLPANELLGKVGLMDKATTTVGKLSGGQQQRFTIAAALVNDPQVIFLDEPTSGLDPLARRHLWEFIQSISQDGRTVVITTHYMEEAQFLCQRVAIMDKGTIVALDTPTNLIHSLPIPYEIKVIVKNKVSLAKLGSLDCVQSVHMEDDKCFYLHSSNAARTLPALMAWSGQTAVQLAHLEVIPANLEDVFLSLTGHAMREETLGGES